MAVPAMALQAHSKLPLSSQVHPPPPPQPKSVLIQVYLGVQSDLKEILNYFAQVARGYRNMQCSIPYYIPCHSPAAHSVVEIACGRLAPCGEAGSVCVAHRVHGCYAACDRPQLAAWYLEKKTVYLLGKREPNASLLLLKGKPETLVKNLPGKQLVGLEPITSHSALTGRGPVISNYNKISSHLLYLDGCTI